jgi:hypothetical protein
VQNLQPEISEIPYAKILRLRAPISGKSQR